MVNWKECDNRLRCCAGVCVMGLSETVNKGSLWLGRDMSPLDLFIKFVSHVVSSHVFVVAFLILSSHL